MQNTAATFLLPSSVYRAHSLLLRAAAERVGVDGDLFLADRERRQTVSDVFATVWLAIEWASVHNEQSRHDSRQQIARFARIRHFEPLPGLTQLARGLSEEGIRQLALLSAAGAFVLAPEQWVDDPDALEAEPDHLMLANAFASEGGLLGDELSAWLIQPETMRRVIELFAILLLHAFAEDDPLAVRMEAPEMRAVSKRERHAMLELWKATQGRVFVSQIVPVGPALTVNAGHAADVDTEAQALPLRAASRPRSVTPASSARRGETAVVWRAALLPPTPVAAKDVQLTAYRPDALCPGQRARLVTFVHAAGLTPQQLFTAFDPQDLRRAAVAQADVTEPMELTFIPMIAGVDVTPRSQSVRVTEPRHKLEFQLQTSAAWVGRTVSGSITVYCGPLIVGVISLSLKVVATAPSRPAGPKEDPIRDLVLAESVPMYRKVFAAYASQDQVIVQHVRGVASTLGEPYLLTLAALRGSEAWSDELAEQIRAADVFQLFWSRHSMRSPIVRREWEYALSLGRPHFVRPTYWEFPMPSAPQEGLPPRELDGLRFERLPPVKIQVQHWRNDRLSPPAAAGKNAVSRAVAASTSGDPAQPPSAAQESAADAGQQGPDNTRAQPSSSGELHSPLSATREPVRGRDPSSSGDVRSPLSAATGPGRARTWTPISADGKHSSLSGPSNNTRAPTRTPSSSGDVLSPQAGDGRSASCSGDVAAPHDEPQGEHATANHTAEHERAELRELDRALTKLASTAPARRAGRVQVEYWGDQQPSAAARQRSTDPSDFDDTPLHPPKRRGALATLSFIALVTAAGIALVWLRTESESASFNTPSRELPVLAPQPVSPAPTARRPALPEQELPAAIQPDREPPAALEPDREPESPSRPVREPAPAHDSGDRDRHESEDRWQHQNPDRGPFGNRTVPASIFADVDSAQRQAKSARQRHLRDERDDNQQVEEAVEPVAPAEPEAPPSGARPDAAGPSSDLRKVILRSYPKGASVYREHEYLGTTPVEVAQPAPGETVPVEVRLAGYTSRRWLLSEASENDLLFKLTPVRRQRRATSRTRAN
ncbi:MAG: TIR domain-containing protein [Polyangiales bacterium]